MNKFEGTWDVSEAEKFFEICKLITSEESIFSKFKTNPFFCGYIGNDIRTKNQANLFLQNINKNLLEDIEKYKINDLLGNPPLHFFEQTKYISSGTLYFLSILSRIINHFGDIKTKSICEIGSGYGGQATILLTYGVRSYTCIDEYRPLHLAKKYLESLNHKKVIFMDNKNIIVTTYDLVISNWCLSEFDDAGIDFYIKNVISKSKNGYFEMNMADLVRKKDLIQKLKLIFNEVIDIPEVVATGPTTNFLLICKNNKNCV